MLDEVEFNFPYFPTNHMNFGRPAYLIVIRQVYLITEEGGFIWGYTKNSWGPCQIVSPPFQCTRGPHRKNTEVSLSQEEIKRVLSTTAWQEEKLIRAVHSLCASLDQSYLLLLLMRISELGELHGNIVKAFSLEFAQCQSKATSYWGWA